MNRYRIPSYSSERRDYVVRQPRLLVLGIVIMLALLIWMNQTCKYKNNKICCFHSANESLLVDEEVAVENHSIVDASMALITNWNHVRRSELWHSQSILPSDEEGGIHAAQATELVQLLERMEKNGRPVRHVCETGFFRGSSSLLWLMSLNQNHHDDRNKIRVHSFDVHVHPGAIQWFKERYPAQMSIHVGDSTVTLEEFHKKNPSFKCDLVFVDGNHRGEGPYMDILHFKDMAHEKTIIIMDDTFDETSDAYNTRPNTTSQGWKLALEEKMVRHVSEDLFGKSCVTFGRTPNNAWPLGQCIGEYVW